jgi:hypothetical protein
MAALRSNAKQHEPGWGTSSSMASHIGGDIRLDVRSFGIRLYIWAGASMNNESKLYQRGSLVDAHTASHLNNQTQTGGC